MKLVKRFGGIGMVGLGLLVAACGSGDKGDKGDPGAQGPAGPAGANGTNGTNGTGTPTFQIIEPRTGLLAREVDVTVSAEGATFDANTTVDFGDAKIAVSNVQVVSPTTLYAHLKIDAAATLGAHDVTVGSLKGTGAFSVMPDITTTVSGGAKQGSFLVATIHNNDHDNFFDPNATNFTVATSGAGLVPFGTSGTTGTDTKAFFIVEPSATVAKSGFTVANDPSTDLSWIGDPNAVDVQANSPTALTLPYTKAGDTLTNPADSKFFKATAPAGSILNFTIDVTDANSTFVPWGIVFTPSGKLTESVGILTPPSGLFGPNPPPYHLIVNIPNTTNAAVDHTIVIFDGAVAGNAKFDMAASATTAATTAEAAAGANAHKTVATAQAVTLPAIVTGSIAAANEVDLYKITVAAGDKIQFSISGAAHADAAFPTTQADPVAIDQNSDVFAIGGGLYTGIKADTFVDTQEFTATAAGTLYFAVQGDPNPTTQTGTYTVTLRKAN